MTADASLLLDIRQLHIQFPSAQGPVQAVRGLDLQLQRGQTLALVGESGCGKSTTALSLLRLLPPEAQVQGQILLHGQDVLALPDPALRAMRGRDVAMIFQDPMSSLNPVYSIGSQLMETLRLHEGVSAKVARQRAIELLDLVRIPQPQQRVDDFPHQLSGGQRQRVMIAMAVACRPRLLVADEPTTALDVTIQAQILALLDRLRRELDMGLLLITHDLGVVAQWADRVAVMYGGEKVEEADTATLFQSPRHPYTQGLMGASLHHGAPLHYRQARLPEIRSLTDTTTGVRRFHLYTPPMPQPHAGAVQRPPSAQQPLPPHRLLDVQALHIHYSGRHGAVKAVDGVSFHINAGETLGLVGESGCGKSTLSRSLLRLIKPTSGRLLLEGTDWGALSEKALQPWRRKVQMVFQDPYASLNPRRTVGEILESVLVVHGVSDRHERRQRICTMLERVGLPADAAQRYPNAFSGGQRQRIGIARALVVRPSLVVLDEPVSALDVSVQAQILNLLAELKADFGLSYLFISHDLAVVRYISDRVLVMHQGQIVESGTPERIWNDPQHSYTQRLLQAVPGAQPASTSFAAGARPQ